MNPESIRRESFLAALLLIAGGLILWNGYSYEPDSRQFPVFLGWLFLIFSAANAVLLFKKLRTEKLSCVLSFQIPNLPLSAAVILSVSAYAAVIPFLGFYLSTLLFMGFVMAGFGGLNKKKLAVYVGAAVLFLIGVYLFFTLLLGTRLPVGELWSFLGE